MCDVSYEGKTVLEGYAPVFYALQDTAVWGRGLERVGKENEKEKGKGIYMTGRATARPLLARCEFAVWGKPWKE